MELNIGKQAVIMNETAFEGALEQPIESDVLLPDYCPDIVKILRCFCSPKIVSSVVTGDKLSVDMNCVIKVYYLGADKNIRCIEQRMPYTKTCDLKGPVQSPVTDVSCKADYVNCRAVNQRRFEIRCAVTLSCRVLSRRSQDIVCDASGDGIQLKTTTCDVTEITADVARPFSLHEDLELATQKPAVQSIIRQHCTCRLGDYKVIGGKVIVKGELFVHLLYQSENEKERPEIMEYTLPVSQIVDVDGVDEEHLCEVDLNVVSSEFTPKSNLEGESRLIAMDCTLRARVRSHRQQSLSLITDCYSTQYECRMERVPLSCISLQKVVDERFMHKCTMNVLESISSVIDLFCYVTDSSSRMENGAVVALFKVIYCMFAYDEQGEITYHEQPEECELRIPLENAGDNVLFTPRGAVLSASFSISGSTSLECRCEVAVGGSVYAMLRPKAATALTCDTDKPKARGEDASLIIYYADGGEDIWEIAKRYNTSITAVMSENALENTSLSDKRMLLIPIV